MKRTKHTKHSIYAPKNSEKTKCIHHKIRFDRQFYREIAKSVCGCMLSSFDLVLLLYEFFSIFRGEYDILSPGISFSFNHLLILIILNFNETDSLGMRIGLFLFFYFQMHFELSWWHIVIYRFNRFCVPQNLLKPPQFN